MLRRRDLALMLAMVGLGGTTAGASAVSYKVEEVVMDGLPVYSGENTTALPDLTAGGSSTLAWFEYPNTNLSNASTSQPISGGFGFLIQGFDASGNAVGPLLDVDGRYSGTLYSGGVPAREAADFTGAATSVDSPTGAPIPEALQDLVNNPGRIQITSQVSVGADAVSTIEAVNLTLAPATAPEPSTLILLLSAAGLGWLARKRPRRP